jgi:hypothetical protein
MTADPMITPPSSGMTLAPREIMRVVGFMRGLLTRKVAFPPNPLDKEIDEYLKQRIHAIDHEHGSVMSPDDFQFPIIKYGKLNISIIDAMEGGISYHVNLPPGFGKTLAINNYIAECRANGLRMVIVMPNHDLIKQYIEKNEVPNVFVMEGKIRSGCSERFPQEEQSEWEKRAYLHHCGDCEERDNCPYQQARFRLLNDETLDVIFLVPQHLFFIQMLMPVPDLVVIDESMEQVFFHTSTIEPWLTTHINRTPFRCDTCPIAVKGPFQQKDCDYYMKPCNLNNKLVDPARCANRLCDVSFFDQLFEPEDTQQYFIKEMLKTNDKCFADDTLIYFRFDLSHFFKQVAVLIFNCATTDTAFGEQMLGRHLVRITSDEEVENEIFSIDYKGGINAQEKVDLDKYFLLHGIPKDDCVVMCKEKHLGKPFQVELEAKGFICEHYGKARGTNIYEKYNNVVLLGRYGWKQHQVSIFSKLFNYPMERMAISEMKQALHRIRPLLYPNKRIFLLTNELDEEGFTPKHSATPAILSACYKIMDMLPATRKEIREKTNTSNHVKAIKYMLEINYMTEVQGRFEVTADLHEEVEPEIEFPQDEDDYIEPDVDFPMEPLLDDDDKLPGFLGGKVE